MRVQTYINEGPGMFTGYEAGDLLLKGPLVYLDESRVVTGTPRDAKEAEDIDVMWLEHVWAIGNRMGADHEAVRWPSNVRSLSVGDVAVIGERAYSVDVVGWTPVDVGDLLRSLDPEQQIHNTRLEESRR